MKPQLQIRAYHRRELCQTATLSHKLQVGRQRPGEPEPFHFDASTSRLIVAPFDDQSVSREHLAICFVSKNDNETPQIEIRNLSRKRSVLIEGHGKLGPEESRQVVVPVLVSFEDFAIRIEQSGPVSCEVRSLERPTLAPGAPSIGAPSLISQKSILHAPVSAGYPTDQLIGWLKETMHVLQRAAGDSNYLAQAVNAVDQIVGLNMIAALRYENGEWSVAEAKESGNDGVGSDSRFPSRTILQEVLDKKSTIYHVPAGQQAAASLQDVKALVASPILNADGGVIGALYGARYSRDFSQLPQISELEATLVEVIACGAAAGIAREIQQQKALEARIQFEQFFTPQLARELESNPGLLDGQDAEVSILFCDIVGFSSISQRIGSQLTLRWISDVMGYLSDAVLNHEGVVVDYIGDEIMAMWGAPKQQEDHAIRASLASRDLMRCKGEIDRVWRNQIGEPIDFRIGICSGIASVGNTGSMRRLKYGPLGSTVNLASRLQSAAKHFGVRRLISQATAADVADQAGLCCRPLGTARFVNMLTPVEIYELGNENASFRQLALGFETLLEAIAQNDVRRASEVLDKLCIDFPDDIPIRMLRRRLVVGQGLDSNCLWHMNEK